MGAPRHGVAPRAARAILASRPAPTPMRRISSHIPLIAALLAVCLAGETVAVGAALAASNPPVDKAALNKAVQEALAKAKTEGGSGAAQGAAGAGSAGAGAAGGGSAGGSGASSEAFSNLTGKGGEEERTTTTPTTANTSSTSSNGISTSVIVPILAAAVIVLGGIAFFIVRDARSVAPAGDWLGSAGSAQDRAARQRKRRAKAKAARRQRKRNR